MSFKDWAFAILTIMGIMGFASSILMFNNLGYAHKLITERVTREMLNKKFNQSNYQCVMKVRKL